MNMKKLVFVAAAILAAAAVFAQKADARPEFGPRDKQERPAKPDGQAMPERKAPEKTTVTGTLVYDGGFISLKSDAITYHVGGIGKLVGFVDGLKENATVTLEGYAMVDGRGIKRDSDKAAQAGKEAPAKDASAKDAIPAPKHFFRATKVSINGRDYELPAKKFAPGRELDRKHPRDGFEMRDRPGDKGKFGTKSFGGERGKPKTQSGGKRLER
jgi:hypothetical protein